MCRILISRSGSAPGQAMGAQRPCGDGKKKKKHLIFSSEAEILSYFSFDKCGIHPCDIKEHLGLSTQLPGCATVQEGGVQEI